MLLLVALFILFFWFAFGFDVFLVSVRSGIFLEETTTRIWHTHTHHETFLLPLSIQKNAGKKLPVSKKYISTLHVTKIYDSF